MKPNNTPSLLINQAIVEFKEWIANRGLSKETLRGYDMDTRQFSRWLTAKANSPVILDEITLPHIEDFVSYLINEKEIKPSSVNRKINALSTFFQCMKKKKYITDNPMEDFQRMKVPESERIYLSKEEVEAIIQAIDHPVIHYFAMTMAYSGLRINECIHLTLNDVNFEDNLIQVINGKGGKNRTIPMNKHLKIQLEKYLNCHRPDTDSLFFFALKKTGTVSTQYVNRELKEACEKAGIKKHVTSHILRHSFASYLVKKDTHVAVIQRLLGHASVKTTSVYLHVQQDDLQAAVNQIDF
ncbi:tyrosine-type recombinase/integrase [Bacillus sp. BRMEA1]|uniref:tyrosine-type recombinase/integrase n=1 Tax=Neobacillus endophyticus TaxID=2738405 RepID=UPI001563460E|nr:tyrosine-type recombinase/integrase [Neobacillus endophyticus]NRD77315.1 tyrosine-type recombinase/integrase [Neobacillus endophyticus]